MSDTELHNLLYSLMSSSGGNKTTAAASDFWQRRETLTAYPPRLFANGGARLSRDSFSVFPRDNDRFDAAIASQVSLQRYWRLVASSLIDSSPSLRLYDIDTFEVDTILVPLLSVALHDSLPIAEIPLSTQRDEYEALSRKMRLVVSNMDSLYHWAMSYCNNALILVRLSDDNLRRVRQLDETRYSNRVRALDEERVRLDALLRRAEIDYEHALNRYRTTFARELSEREKIVDVLTNYLSGTLFRVRNPSYVEPRHPVRFERGDVQRRVESLIPYYRKLRMMLIERGMLQKLIVELRRYAAESNANHNPLVERYF